MGDTDKNVNMVEGPRCPGAPRIREIWIFLQAFDRQKGGVAGTRTRLPGFLLTGRDSPVSDDSSILSGSPEPWSCSTIYEHVFKGTA